MSKKTPARSTPGRTAAQHNPRHQSTPATAAEPSPPAARLSFGVLCLLLIAAPYFLSGVIYPASGPTLDVMAGDTYLPLAIFLSLTACVCLLLALVNNNVAVNEANTQSRFGNVLPLLLCGFFLWSCIAAITTVYLHDTLLELSRIVGCIAWFFIARKLLGTPGREAKHWWILSAITAGAVIVCAIAVVSYFQSRGAQFSTFYNPNLFANYCAMAFPLALGWAALTVRATKTLRPERPLTLVLLLTLLPTILIALGLLSSSSKGGLLAFLVGALVFFLAVWRAQSGKVMALLRAHALAVGIGVLLVFAGGGFVFSKTVLPRLQEASSLNDHSTMFRVYTWRSTLDMAQARPLLGWGPGSFPSAYSQFAIAGPTGSAHQLWLQIAAENGLPALLLLAAVVIAAAAKFWKALRGANWPVAAAGLGALAAFIIHGLTDAGWSMTSIVVLLMVLLALSDTPGQKSDDSESPPASALDWPWLGAALIFAIAAMGAQRAVQGEDLRAQAMDNANRGATQTAMENARAATEADPLSSRTWNNLARFQAASREDAMPAFTRALTLQPTRPASYLTVAEYLAQLPQSDPKQVEQYFNRAVELDPNNSSVRLARAKWLLERNDKRGWDDLEYVAKLADEPYGKYPATPQFVNLDFAQAYIRLAPRLLQRGDSASREKAKVLIQRGLGDVQRARAYEAEINAYREVVPNSGDDREELATVENKLNELAPRVGIKATENTS